MLTKSRPRLPIQEKLGYACGDFASVLFWAVISNQLIFFYTDVFGISAFAAGTMIMVSRIWDGVNDPVMGMIADRTNTKWGKFRPYLLWTAVPLAVMGVITFTTPDLSTSGKLVYASVTFVLFMTAYTAINIPYSSLLAVISPDSIERADVASYKYIFAYAAGFVVSVSLLPLARIFGQGVDAKGWQLTLALYGAVAVIFFLITFRTTRERVAPKKSQKTTVKQDLKDLAGNRPWLILLGVTLFMILFIALRSSVTTHYFKYYVGDQFLTFWKSDKPYDYVALTSGFNGVGQAFCILGVICTKWIAGPLGKKKAFLVLFAIDIIGNSAFFFMAPDDITAMFVFQAIASFAGGPLVPLIWAMYADTADFADWKNGRRATGLVFSASTMSQKIGWAVGSFFIGALLNAVGFVPDSKPTEGVRIGLKALMSLIPAAFGVISMAVMFLYKLDEKTMENIASDLRRRQSDNDEIPLQSEAK